MLALGANLTLDRTLHLDRLRPGSVHRPRAAEVTPGGKSVNLCRAARAHGVRPRFVANLPGRFGEIIGDMLEAEGHAVRRVVTTGEARSAIIILEDDLRVTVLNEAGPALSAADHAAVLGALEEEMAGQRVVVATGSLPPAAPLDMYGQVARLARAAGVLSIVDAARDALLACLEQHPDVVIPNLAEAEAALSGQFENEAVEPQGADVRGDALAAACGLRSGGARAALVTAGRHGVAGVDSHGCFWIGAPKVIEVNPIGAGDSFAAGLAVGLERGLALREASLLAVATGSASVANPLAGGVDGELVARLLPSLCWESV
jgi:1-phosphofructokinase family hexose kinase